MGRFYGKFLLPFSIKSVYFRLPYLVIVWKIVFFNFFHEVRLTFTLVCLYALDVFPYFLWSLPSTYTHLYTKKRIINLENKLFSINWEVCFDCYVVPQKLYTYSFYILLLSCFWSSPKVIWFLRSYLSKIFSD